MELTVRRAGQTDSSRQRQGLGIGHLQTVGHVVISGAVDFQSNLRSRFQNIFVTHNLKYMLGIMPENMLEKYLLSKSAGVFVDCPGASGNPTLGDGSLEKPFVVRSKGLKVYTERLFKMLLQSGTRTGLKLKEKADKVQKRL